jgi:hypothetical protein
MEHDIAIYLTKAVERGVIAPFPRYELLKSPFPELAFSPGRDFDFSKQRLMKIPVQERWS